MKNTVRNIGYYLQKIKFNYVYMRTPKGLKKI